MRNDEIEEMTQEEANKATLKLLVQVERTMSGLASRIHGVVHEVMNEHVSKLRGVHVATLGSKLSAEGEQVLALMVEAAKRHAKRVAEDGDGDVIVKGNMESMIRKKAPKLLDTFQKNWSDLHKRMVADGYWASGEKNQYVLADAAYLQADDGLRVVS